MKFSDTRKTIIKQTPPPAWLADRKPADLAPVELATPRRLAPPEFSGLAFKPAQNRADRRAAGRYRGHRRSALRRAIHNAHYRPGKPWQPVVDAEIVEAD